MIIYKTAVPLRTPRFTIQFAVPFRLLAVKMQDGFPFMWFELESKPTPDTPPAKRFQRVYRLEATGVEFEQVPSEKMTYVETFVIPDAAFVGHLYEIGGLSK